MTPRYDWTWNGGNFFASVSIRFFCWQHCSCAVDLDETLTGTETDNRLWTLPFGQQVTQSPNGAIYIHPLGPAGPGRRVQILPPQQGAGSSSGGCGKNGTDFCPQAWDEHIYGLIPRASANTTDIIRPPTDIFHTVCGNTCHSLSDCGSVDRDYSCSCAFPSFHDARRLGLDPIHLVAACLALFTASIQGKLGGRSVPNYVDARGVPHTCRCNERETGRECCGQTNGDLPAKILNAL